jgi:hypothetical protein
MGLLREIARAEVAILIAGLGVLGLWKILRARPGLGGRLGSRDQTGHWVAGALRWQMGLITVAVALVYLLSSLGAAGSGTLPPVPWWALVVLALSHGAWLASVARRRPGSRLS